MPFYLTAEYRRVDKQSPCPDEIVQYLMRTLLVAARRPGERKGVTQPDGPTFRVGHAKHFVDASQALKRSIETFAAMERVGELELRRPQPWGWSQSALQL